MCTHNERRFGIRYACRGNRIRALDCESKYQHFRAFDRISDRAITKSVKEQRGQRECARGLSGMPDYVRYIAPWGDTETRTKLPNCDCGCKHPSLIYC